jgi:hypothetical protein
MKMHIMNENVIKDNLNLPGIWTYNDVKANR